MDSECSACGNTHPKDQACNAPDPRIGLVLDGKYEIVRVLGAGGMGRVYEARHRGIGRRVAAKFLLSQFAEHKDILRRFENEARTAGSLEHENIAAVLDFGRANDGSYYSVMEFLSGEDCERLLAREGALSVPRAIGIIDQVCRGLAAAHERGVIHRDLKPANLFLCRRADGSDLVKILDFGIAKLRSAVTETAGASRTTGPIGTAFYMSPEQARGDAHLDTRSDIYALGVILYEMLSGHRPHDGDSVLQIIHRVLTARPAPLASLRPSLPPGLCELVERAMAFEPHARFASVEELAEALQQARAPSHSHPAPRSVAAGTIASPNETDASNRGQPERPAASTRAPVVGTLTTNAPVMPDASATGIPKRFSATLIVPAAIAAGLVVIGGIWIVNKASASSPTVAPAPTAPAVVAAAPAPEPSTAPAQRIAPLDTANPVIPAPGESTSATARTDRETVRTRPRPTRPAASAQAPVAGSVAKPAETPRFGLTVDKDNPFQSPSKP